MSNGLHKLMEYYRIPLYIFFGILPSFVWLLYYLRKDIHPEPKKLILKIFIFGALVTLPVFILQIALAGILDYVKAVGALDGYSMAADILKWFVVIALTEELLKYAVVRMSAFKSKDMDEPLDIMLYMVVAALGFAALENILYLFSPIYSTSFQEVFKNAILISFVRFIGATFLHTLCSALLGYFMALASIRSHKKVSLTITGIVAATLLHGLYNFSIINLPGSLKVIIPITIIVGLSIFIIYDFDEIKKLKSICKI